MSDRASDSQGPPRPDAVRRSLRALADGSAPPREPTAGTASPDTGSLDPESVVGDAERAAASAREGASFLSAGRLPDLDRAVATAARRGHDDIAARGRSARESLRRLDAALEGEEGADRAADAGSEPGLRRRGDHFHSGRGTVLGDTAQRPDR